MPLTRRTQRESALKIHYALIQTIGTYREDTMELTANQYHLELTDFVRQLVKVSCERHDELKTVVWSLAKDPEMIAGLDLLIMIQGMCELELEHSPPKTIINEYIELAKLYGADNAFKFVNVILNAFKDRAPHD
ncbi:transcription antitermination factor NusB [Chrysiogenes arsenatis]|uniref:transcription antitermination factor NusB n=1 Tax=Chrysiogenes arsenatis TaxID=309797 RepID=UPI0004042AAF|nr:transcription antitermination factor NusB [Chrysiogenes arsenatis]